MIRIVYLVVVVLMCIISCNNKEHIDLKAKKIEVFFAKDTIINSTMWVSNMEKIGEYNDIDKINIILKQLNSAKQFNKKVLISPCTKVYLLIDNKYSISFKGDSRIEFKYDGQYYKLEKNLYFP